MQRVISDAMITAGSAMALVLALVLFDDRVREQLGPSWKRIVTVKSRDRENVEIYVDTRGDGKTVRGLMIISAEPRELTLVNLVGPVDIEKLSSLEGQFGIPRMSREKDKEKEKRHD